MMNLFLFDLSKTEMGAKTAPREPKLGYFDGRVPKFRSRGTLATSGAGVVCHAHIHKYFITFLYQYFIMLPLKGL